jgi:DNA-binding transcriptional LysR family regulator
VSLAAEVLGVDPSTCSRRLSALEAVFGKPLFLRTKTGLTATEAGAAAIAHAGDVEARVARLVEARARGPEGPSGPVRLVGNPWTLEQLAATAVPALLDRHPRLDLRLVPVLPRATVRLEATLALWFETPPQAPEFAIRLADVPYAFYARRGSDPAALPWVSFHDEDSPRLAHARALDRVRRPGERVRLLAGDNRVLAAAIAAGVGKGLLPVCVAARLPDLARVGDGPPELVRTLHLHLHPDTVQTQRVQAVTRWLRESVATAFGATP